VTRPRCAQADDTEPRPDRGGPPKLPAQADDIEPRRGSRRSARDSGARRLTPTHGGGRARRTLAATPELAL